MKELAGQFRISLLAAGDDKSRGRIFEEIWHSYQPRIAVFIRHTLHCGAEEGEDITQEVFLRVYRNLHRYNPVYPFNVWIYTLARNCCIDSQRKTIVRRRSGSAERLPGDCAATFAAQDQEQQLIAKQTSAFIADFIQSLEAEDRQAAFLRFYEGLSYRAAARVLGIPAGTLKYRIHVIRQKLKAALEQNDAIRS